MTTVTCVSLLYQEEKKGIVRITNIFYLVQPTNLLR
jgi:hypothetical protein